MRSKILSLGLLSFFLCSFTNREFTGFYDVYVQDVVNTLTGTTPGLTSYQKFSNQYFTLWFSPVADETADLPTYYNQVVAFCKNYNIRKIIWYFSYTSPAMVSFYNPVSTDPQSMIQLLQSNPLPSYTQIEFFFDCSSMSGTPYSGVTPAPGVPTVIPPSYMQNMYNTLWWARDMFNAISDVTLMSGVTIDPEDDCGGSNAPYTTPSDAYQGLVNYMDNFRSLNSDFALLERGMTFGGDARNQIFGNRAPIPITDANLIVDTDAIPSFYNGTSPARTTPWVRPDPAAPFLENIYPQLYNLGTPYIYTLKNMPQQAGLNFIELLSNTPYCPGLTLTGTNSTISFTTGSPLVSGVGSQFLTELASSGLNTNSPIAFINAIGEQQCLTPNIEPNYPDTPVYLTCSGKVAGVASNTQMNVSPSPTTTQNGVNWLYVANEIQYREYHITSEMVSGIFLMFSGESSFFGQWTLDQFMDFVIAFYNQGQTSYSPYFNVTGGVGTPIPVPNQFAIFTYEQITGQAAGAPNPPWFPNPN